jgi:predicted site-specific integrase-resolvase
MTPPNKVSESQLTTKEFSHRCGKPVATVQKWLRSGKLKGTKIGSRWYIAPSELTRLSTSESTSAAPTTAATPRSSEAKAPIRSPGSTYTVEEFSALTYLTQTGVRRWLRNGRLVGERARDGSWMVKAESLELPHLRHLIRV